VAIALIASVAVATEEPDASVAKERLKLQGTWSVVSAEENGKKLDATRFAAARVLFDGNTITREGMGAKQVSTYTLDLAKKPKVIDGTDERGHVSRGIYELDGDTLKLCWTVDKERPVEFATKPGTGQCLVVFRRVKP
jgi:uncharacterized protein (TIGR03067 family)